MRPCTHTRHRHTRVEYKDGKRLTGQLVFLGWNETFRREEHCDEGFLPVTPKAKVKLKKARTGEDDPEGDYRNR